MSHSTLVARPATITRRGNMPCPPGTAGWLGSQTTHTLYDMNCELFLKRKGDVMGGIPVMGVVSDSYL